MTLSRLGIVTIALASLALGACSSLSSSTDNRATDLAEVERVVEAFRTAIIKKDKPAFLGLFISDRPERVTWQSVIDDAGLRNVQKKRPEARKARYRPDNNFVAFIDELVASKTAEEEKFSDVRIDTDGEIASVSFDYAYFSDGRETNYGKEKWLLVRTERGWKITSVIYSIRLPETATQ